MDEKKMCLTSKNRIGIRTFFGRVYDIKQFLKTDE